MGNKRNRAPRRKNPIPNSLKKIWREKKEKRQVSSTATNNVPIDMVSVLVSTSNIELECDEGLDPIGMTTENSIENYENNHLLSYNDLSMNEYSLVELIDSETELSESTENFEDRKHEMIDAFENKCRLCLTEDERTWIDLFSSEPYKDSGGITPSNILELIEQFTTTKISKHDRLPDKLCITCLQSLRVMYEFREKSLRSKETLDLALHKHDEQRRLDEQRKLDEQKKVLKKTIRLKPIQHLTINRDENKKIIGGVKCDTCGKKFERLNSLQYHLNRHTGLKPFACAEPYCEKSFYSPQNLKAHVFTVHTIEPRYKCDVENCKKVYNKAYNLKIHRTTHFPPTIPCSICGKLLRSQVSVIKHRASHAERRFKCDDCGKSFQTGYTLRIHRRIHTNEKPFICCKCAEAFAYNCLLKAHTEKYHPT